VVSNSLRLARFRAPVPAGDTEVGHGGEPAEAGAPDGADVAAA